MRRGIDWLLQPSPRSIAAAGAFVATEVGAQGYMSGVQVPDTVQRGTAAMASPAMQGTGGFSEKPPPFWREIAQQVFATP